MQLEQSASYERKQQRIDFSFRKNHEGDGKSFLDDNNCDCVKKNWLAGVSQIAILFSGVLGRRKKMSLRLR